MTTHIVVGPTEDQTYSVVHVEAGCYIWPIVAEHMSEWEAVSEAQRLSAKHAAAIRKAHRARQLGHLQALCAQLKEVQ